MDSLVLHNRDEAKFIAQGFAPAAGNYQVTLDALSKILPGVASYIIKSCDDRKAPLPKILRLSFASEEELTFGVWEYHPALALDGEPKWQYQ